jgi:hypothetical protein
MDTRTKKIIQLYENRVTLVAIGRLFGISRQRIHQIILRNSPESVNRRKFPEIAKEEKKLSS